jgi:DNA helicase-2/ATP-dependent DNA helicase PcrA
MTDFTPRPAQTEILTYTGGRLGISAVPGSGKTHTLSALAADLITRGALAPDQEVLIVTLVNSAVDNFTHRIASFVQQRGLIPHLGYRVRTLHGLAHDIVREKPARVGLEERFQIVDEQEANRIRLEAVHAWLASNRDVLEPFLDPGLDEGKRDWVRRQHLPALVESLALAFIRSAKDRRLSPDQLRIHLEQAPAPLPLAEMGLAIYADYQRALQYRGAVDFDDLIRLSLDLLTSDPEYLERLHYRFPYLLEDEAQDSSELQEQILGLLAGPDGNWVRVGDPNQAIFETFTTASPELLRRFIAVNPHVDMPESGRSQPVIIDLANHLIEWTMNDHPEPGARSALSPPFIRPTDADDPQRNPPEDPSAVQFIGRKFTPDAELESIVKSLQAWLPEHPDRSVAVLVPRNQRGAEVIDALKKKGLETVEFLASTSKTRATAGSLNRLLAFLADPQSAAKLSKVYQVWRRDWRSESGFLPLYRRVSELLRKCREVEAFLAPIPGADWLDTVPPLPSGENTEGEDDPGVRQELEQFRRIASRWLEAVTLPIDQLVLTLAADVFTEPADLALVHKLALVLRQAAQDHGDWRLPELTDELAVIARNERRFIGFSIDDSGFDPDRHRGKVVVTTMHKAKGLEWDRVYLMSANNYDFPSNQPNDQFIAEKWFVRGNLNLEAEALAQLRIALSTGEYDVYTEGRATALARLDYVKERLRLLYVGITRAREDLILTYNTGRQGEATPALGFVALQGWWEEKNQ